MNEQLRTSFEESPEKYPSKLQPLPKAAFRVDCDKENADPQLPPHSDFTPKGGLRAGNELPHVIMELSEALEVSNNTVQTLKAQLETVLQRETTLQLEHELLGRRYEAAMVARTQLETHGKEREAKTSNLQEQLQHKVDELQETSRQRQKLLEAKNAEIATLTQKLYDIQGSHAADIAKLQEQLDALKINTAKSVDEQA